MAGFLFVYAGYYLRLYFRIYDNKTLLKYLSISTIPMKPIQIS